MHKAFDAVVRRRKAVRIDQVLVNGHGVAAQEQLGLNEVAVDFAQAGGSGNENRWPLRGNLKNRVASAGGSCEWFCGRYR